MKVLDGAKLREMFTGGYKQLKLNKALVDSLNVFPVPDGDTGTNMTLTMASAIKEIDAVKGDDVQDIMTAYARGALKGARGNSGVILSQIIKGLTRVLGDAESITTKAFAQALISARETAYNAVTKPKEGTVLTVIRGMAEYAPTIAGKLNTFEQFLDAIIRRGEEILQKTPDMLPVLKKAGVVDAGGKGLIFVFQGFYNALTGVEIAEEASLEENPAALPQLGPFGNDEHDFDNIAFAYCTEYFIINLKRHITEEDVEKLRDRLMAIGDCVIVIGDISLVKVHVHTNQPNKALMYALQLGELDKVKIENMLEQNRALVKAREESKKSVGMVAICAGAGISKIFKDLTVDEVIEGGQTMNPSVENILDAVEKVNSDNVIILPNNKNIVLAAEKVGELTQKHVFVIPTGEMAEGIHAALAFDPDSDAETNAEVMRESFASLKCGQVTHAVRKTNLDGFELEEGDIIGLDAKKIIAKSSSVEDAAVDVVRKLCNDDTEVITIYYGEDVSEEDANKLTERLEEEYDDYDVVTYYGGQPHYFYFICVE